MASPMEGPVAFAALFCARMDDGLFRAQARIGSAFGYRHRLLRLPMFRSVSQETLAPDPPCPFLLPLPRLCVFRFRLQVILQRPRIYLLSSTTIPKSTSVCSPHESSCANVQQEFYSFPPVRQYPQHDVLQILQSGRGLGRMVVCTYCLRKAQHLCITPHRPSQRGVHSRHAELGAWVARQSPAQRRITLSISFILGAIQSRLGGGQLGLWSLVACTSTPHPT